MKKNEAERNVVLYAVFQAFSEPLFVGTILISFLERAAGMSLEAIFQMEAICVLGIVLLQVPSGALADLIGRRKTILLGTLFIAVDRFMFAAAQSQIMAWMANLAWVVGYSLISGADSSLLYDSLKFLGRESEFKKIDGRASAWRLFLIAASCPLSGYLAEINLRLPMILGALPVIIFVLTAWLFVEPPFAGEKKYTVCNQWKMIKTSVLFVANHSRVKWTIGFVVFLGAVSKTWFFTYNPYFELVDLEPRYWGWLFLALNLVAAATSYGADWLARKIGDEMSIILMPALIAAPIIVAGTLICQAAAYLVLFQNLVRGYMSPFMNHFLHSHLDSKNRATVNSIKGAVDGLAQFLLLGAFGLLLGAVPLPAGLQILGLFALAGGGFFVGLYSKIFPCPKEAAEKT